MTTCNEQQTPFNLNAILLAAQANNQITKHCTGYELAILQDEHFKNIEWQLTPFNESMMAEIPLVSSLKQEDLIIFDLFDPEFSEEGFRTIVISKNGPPTLFCTRTYLPEEGYDFQNFNLVAAHSLVEVPSLAAKTFEVFRLLINASTKLSDEERAMWLSRADTELATISNYISNYIATPCPPQRLSADVQLIIDYYYSHFFEYWKVIEAHKVTDFNFTTEK